MEQESGLGTCLNPYERHPAPDLSHGRLLCTEPSCGYLLAGAFVERWQVSALLGKGPIADLYLATAADASAAGQPKMLVKVVRAPLIGPLGLVEQRLGQLLALRHPHIHPLQSVGWASPAGMLYFLSAYEELGSLSRYPGATVHLPPLATAGIVRQIAEALQFAHERQITHGRIQLDNCLLVAPATVQVCDFYDFILSHDARFASSSFVAPEQLYGQAEAASDQYALALMTYRLLIGQLPFAESEPRAAVVAHNAALPRPISEFRSDLSVQVDQTLGRALSRRSQDRFPSITAFAVALQGALETTTPGSVSSAGRVISQFPSLSDPGAISGPSVSQPASVPTRLSTPGQLVPLCRLPGHTSEAILLRWAPDGVHLASAGGNQSIRLWRIERQIGTPVTELAGHSGEALALSWAPNGLALATGGADATVRLWDPAAITAQTAWWGHDGSVQALDWSPTGAQIASGGADRTIRLWDRGGKAVSVWQGHARGGVTALAWSPDGRVLATGGADRRVQLWDVATGGVLMAFDAHTDEIRHLAWSPTGAVLASYARKKDSRICLWSRQTGQLLAELTGHTREVVGLFWSSDGAWLASASADSTLRYWDTHLRMGEPIGWPIHLQSAPVSMAGAARSGLIALGMLDLLLQVLQLQVQLVE